MFKFNPFTVTLDIDTPPTYSLLDSRYLVKAGVTGGQTAIGGTGVTDILKLQGTSGNGTLTAIAIQGLVGNNGATVAFTVLNNGNVGIGTTGPGAKLDIFDSTGVDTLSSQFSVRGVQGAGQPGFMFERSDGAGKFINMWTGSSGAVLAFTDTASRLAIGVNTYANRYSSSFPTTEIMSLLPSGNVGIGTTSPLARLGVVGADALNTSFAANIGGSTGTGLVVTNAGNVGIGTTSPNVNLSIYSSTANLRIKGTNGATLGLYSDNHDDYIMYNSYGWLNIRNVSDGRDDIKIQDNGNIFLAPDNGNVGIGTMAPGAKLEVASGNVFFGDTANANMTQGLTINQGAADNEILSLKSSDIAHGVTDATETDTFATFSKYAATTGGLMIETYNESANYSFGLLATAGVVDTTKSTAGRAITEFRNYIVSGTARGTPTTDANLVAIKNGGTTRFIFDAEGTLHSIGATGTDTFGANGMLIMSGNVGIGTTSPDRLVHAEVVNTTTNAVSYGLRLTHICSTASTGLANGGGVGIEFELETATDTTNQIAATIESTWVDATNATRKGNLSLYAYDTAARLGIQVAASGSAAQLGFYGVTPVVRPTALTTQLTTITCSAPGTPDYAIADLTATVPYGFASADEGQSVLKVIANLQTRVSELETKLQGLGILT